MFHCETVLQWQKTVYFVNRDRKLFILSKIELTISWNYFARQFSYKPDETPPGRLPNKNNGVALLPFRGLYKNSFGNFILVSNVFSTVVLIEDTVNKQTNITNRTQFIKNPNWWKGPHIGEKDQKAIQFVISGEWNCACLQLFCMLYSACPLWKWKFVQH